MKCIDCDNLGWVSDEGEQVWGWCRYRRSCPDPDIDRDCPNFALKRPPMLQQLKAENENLRAEMKRMEACIYYKAGGFCRYGGDDPANVCVLGPCANEVAAHEFFAETVAEKGGRDHPDPPDPLTQEQLREMDGQPVYVIINGVEPLKMWCLIEIDGDDIYLINNLGGRSSYADMVKLYKLNLYRRPPEGETHE